MVRLRTISSSITSRITAAAAALAEAFANLLSPLHRSAKMPADGRPPSLEQAHQALLAEKAFSDAVIDGLPGVFYVYDEEARLLRWNSNTARVTGYTPAELFRVPMGVLVAPEERERLAEKVRQVFTRGYADTELTLLAKDGTRTPYFFTGIKAEIGGRVLLIGAGIDIAGRLQAEARLRELDRQQKALLNNIPDLAWLKDRESRFIAVNRPFADACGLSPDVLAGKTDLDIWPAALAESYRAGDAAVMAAGTRKRVEEPLLDSDGRQRWIETIKTPIYDDRGEVIGTVGIARDITRRKTAEELLRVSEEKFRSLIEFATDWIWEIDSNGVYIYSSPKVRDILGYEPEEILGRTPFDLMTAPEAERVGPQISAIIAARKPFQRLENANRRKDGGIVILETNGVPIFDPQGRWTGYRGIDRDITERKHGELALKESEERYRLLTELSPDMIGIQQEGRFVYINRRGVELLGGERPEQFLGAPIMDVVHPAYRPLAQERIRRSLDLGVMNPFLEEKFLRLDGTAVDVEVASVSFLHQGKPATVVIARDITERKQTARALEELNRTLQQRVEAEVAKNLEKDRLMMVQSRQAAMGEMLGNVAHQWRQPLNVIGLIIQDLQDAQANGLLAPDYLDKSVRRAMDVLQHMSQTIDDFRLLYRTEKKRQTFSVNAIIERVLTLVQGGFRDHRIDLNVDLGETVTLDGYPGELSQAILNVLINARDVLVERAVRTPRVTVRLCRAGGRVCVTVADNGGGIPDGIRDRIFDPYFTTKEEGRGTGIGLYLSKIIVEKNMGGTLSARNTADGAEFRIEL